MIYDPATAHHLKPWLVRTLEPICDAEPGALADYILALLKHNVSEPDMRKELLVQLDEFLEKECAPFIDTLFTVLRTKSFLPYVTEPAPPKPVDNGIPIPLDLIAPSPTDTSIDRSRKRSIEADDKNNHPSAKGARVNAEGQFSRYGNGNGRSSGQWEGRRDEGLGHAYTNGGMEVYNVHTMGGMGHLNGGRRPVSYQPPDQKRGICRDYHNNGYCARGVMCKYSHGEDAMVPGQLYPMPQGMPFLPIFPVTTPFGPGGGYDPNDSRMDMRPRHQRAPMLARTHQEQGGMVQTSGELPVIQDLTPSTAKDPVDAAPSERQIQSQNEIPPENDQPQSSQPTPPFDAPYGPQLYPGMQGMSPMGYMPMQSHTDAGMVTGHRGGYRGRGRGRGRGTFGGELHNFRPERRGDKTLVVEKIPDEKLSLENVNDWFKRFGSVTNVAIDKMGGKALVSFSTHDEAHAAWKSEDAVFNNRFVKVFWHRPMEGQGQIGARMLAASASMVANMSAKTSATPSPSVPPSSEVIESTTTKPPSTTPSSTASVLAIKQQLLEQQIAEQKTLMASLETATPGEKRDIMIRLRKLGDEMRSSSAPSAATSQQPAFTIDSKEKKERERLDKELDLHASTVPSSSAASSTEKQETTEELKAKLERLKAEAASLGLNTEAQPGDWHASAPSSYRGGYRGRARGGRGFHRGAPRGGVPRFNMTLDNRPKKLLLKGTTSEHAQAVKDWYETTGQLDSVEPQANGEMIVSFKTRAAAEQGLAKGQNISTVGQIQVSWYAGKASNTSTTPITSDKSAKRGPLVLQEGQTQATEAETEAEAEEEMVARGWGGDDDGDGMGML